MHYPRNALCLAKHNKATGQIINISIIIFRAHFVIGGKLFAAKARDVGSCTSLSVFLYRVRNADVVAAAVAYLFAVYGCNGREFSYVIFTEQRNFTTATEERQRNDGNQASFVDVDHLFLALSNDYFLIALIARLIILIAR